MGLKDLLKNRKFKVIDDDLVCVNNVDTNIKTH